MDPDDFLSPRQSDPLAQLVRQDLDPLSVDELHERIAALQGEIARCEARIAHASSHRSIADSLFKKT